MSQLALKYRVEPLRSLAAASVGAGYTAVGTASTNPARQILISNLTDVTLLFSFDGVDDAFRLAAGTSFIDDICSNTSVQGGSLSLSSGTVIWVKQDGSAATTGTVNVSIFYAAAQ